MVDMGKGQIAVERRIDRGSAWVQAEGAVGKIVHHLVFMLDAAIEAFECQQFVEVKRREAVALHRAEVAARPFDPQHGGRSEERRVGKECVSTCRSRWSPDN